MIVITGAAGFIGSVVARVFNDEGFTDLLLVDDFSRADKNLNLEKIIFTQKIHRDDFLNYWEANPEKVEIVVHLGARTDTTEMDVEIFDRLNLNYSKKVWELAARFEVPLVYASSAATYGLGELGYKDEHAICKDLEPLNPYGRSKNDFDIWALQQEKKPLAWYGLKFFNVYGANEYHKGRMASVIWHAYRQITGTGRMQLFRSHKVGYADGEQMRDFIYVKDVAAVISFLLQSRPQSGIYNLGTGAARTFKDLAVSTFNAMGLEPKIDFIDTPVYLRDKYQYFTQADMNKLQEVGYNSPFFSLENGVEDYVQQYLMLKKYF
jgi:ADP-L-glycero-D-manno-heptose 6-epimerase